MSEDHLSDRNGASSKNTGGPLNFRLLYPADASPDLRGSFAELPPGVWRDLGLDTILAAFTSNREYQGETARVLSTLVQDPEVIRYRQAVLEDLLNHPALVKRIGELLPVIDSLAHYSFRSGQEANALHEVAWRVGELQSIVDCTLGLAEIFRELAGKLASPGLRGLEQQIQEMTRDSTFQTLARELPDLLAKTRACASVTIGVNLDASLRPIQATLLSVNDQSFTDQSLMGKLFGLRSGREGIAPLHSVPQRVVEGHVALPISSDLGWAVEPMMVPLFADLSKILEKAARPIIDQLKGYAELHGSLFINLRQDLIFYLGAVQFIQRLRELDLPACRPEITPFAPRICEVQDSYNANLALRCASKAGEPNIAEAVVRNDLAFGPEGRILILTGPNQGGKTTFMQGVGLIQVLAQVGCFVPGARAQISPVDQIFTHFPLEEKPSLEMGRLGEEATRLGQIFQRVTRDSLVLLNESLASTSSGESFYLAQDIVKALRRLGARAIYATHLHELANCVGEINASVAGESVVVSVVSSPVYLGQNASETELPRTFKVENRPPLGQSFARQIAARYGISYEQLEQVLRERGVL